MWRSYSHGLDTIPSTKKGIHFKTQGDNYSNEVPVLGSGLVGISTDLEKYREVKRTKFAEIYIPKVN